MIALYDYAKEHEFTQQRRIQMASFKLRFDATGNATPAGSFVHFSHEYMSLRTTTLSRSLRLHSFAFAHRRHPTCRRTYYPDVLPNKVSTSSEEFQAKAAAMDELVADLEAKTTLAGEGGGAKAQERMKGKGKLLPRERYVRTTCTAGQLMQCHTD
jgi:hypothetical protein